MVPGCGLAQRVEAHAVHAPMWTRDGPKLASVMTAVSNTSKRTRTSDKQVLGNNTCTDEMPYMHMSFAALLSFMIVCYRKKKSFQQSLHKLAKSAFH